MAENQEGSKLFFGPEMSPEIFANKWYSKFSNLLDEAYLQPKQRAETDPSWMCVFVMAGVGHIRHFTIEAQRLSLKHKDYPKRGPDALRASRLPPLALRSGEDLLKPMRANPFEQAQYVTIQVDMYAWKLEKVKGGRWMHEMSEWEVLPEHLRKAMGSFFAMIEQGRRSGWWGVTDAARERMERLYLKEDGRVA